MTVIKNKHLFGGLTINNGGLGVPGETGPQGIQGVKGENGPQGVQGDVGPAGAAGGVGNYVLIFSGTTTNYAVDNSKTELGSKFIVQVHNTLIHVSVPPRSLRIESSVTRSGGDNVPYSNAQIHSIVTNWLAGTGYGVYFLGVYQQPSSPFEFGNIHRVWELQ